MQENFVITIDREFQSLIPPLSKDEYEQLERNILAEGIRDALVVWEGILIDGHNRFDIAEKYDLNYQVIDKEFENRDKVKEWIILNQFGRRNLPIYERSKLALQLKSIFEEKAKENQRLSGGAVPQKSAEPIDTRNELAKVAGVSHDTIAKVQKIEQKAPADIKKKLANQEISINQAYGFVKDIEKQERFEENKKAFNQSLLPSLIGNHVFVNNDCRKFVPTLENKSIDLYLTDPPYGMDFKSGWSEKGKIQNDEAADTFALLSETFNLVSPKLKDDAHIYVFGNIDYIADLKEVFENYFTLKNILIWDREVIGMGDLKTYGKSYDIVLFGYNKTWKELNGVRDRDILRFRRVSPNNLEHPTEKPAELLEYIIKKSSNVDDKVLDTFTGGGSTYRACVATNRIFYGSELEERWFNLTNTRLCQQ